MKKFALGVKKSPFPSFFLVKNSALHSENPELLQKNVLGIIESFTKRLLSEKFFRQTIVKWLRFQKNCPWYYVDNFFIEVAKTLPL